MRDNINKRTSTRCWENIKNLKEMEKKREERTWSVSWARPQGEESGHPGARPVRVLSADTPAVLLSVFVTPPSPHLGSFICLCDQTRPQEAALAVLTRV